MESNVSTILRVAVCLLACLCYGWAYDLKVELSAAPAALFKKDKDKAAAAYLDKYGYKSQFCSGECGAEQKRNMLKEFQSMAGIAITGELDDQTVKQMQLPRCGKSDTKFRGFKGRRYRRYNPQGTVWKKVVNQGLPLTWRYAKPGGSGNDGKTQDLSEDDVRDLLKQAMVKWTAYTNVKFQEVFSGTPDIWIYFGTRSHGDPYHFDGAGGTLAHAFYPLSNQGLAGDMHFDDDEWFTKGTSQGRNFLWVATHELGHSLGLAHSNVRKAIMYPYYTGYRPNFQLEQDDIQGIQSIYGKKEIPKPSIPECPESIKAMWMKGSGSSKTIMIATGQNKFYEVDENGNMKASSVAIQGSVDAAFTARLDDDSSEESTVIFSGSTYTIYTTDMVKKSGPYSIHKKRDYYGNLNPLQLHIPSYVRRLDAAMKWQRNNKLYIFYSHNGEGHYRKYDLKNHKLERRGYRVDFPIGVWKDLPKSGVGSAISWPKKTYFSSGGQIYKFNDRSVRVAAGYAKDFGEGGFLKCEKIELP